MEGKVEEEGLRPLIEECAFEGSEGNQLRLGFVVRRCFRLETTERLRSMCALGALEHLNDAPRAASDLPQSTNQPLPTLYFTQNTVSDGGVTPGARRQGGRKA